jgi:Putative transposase/Transposase zinc-binding domain
LVELAEIFRQYGPAYRAKYATSLPPSHLAAMQAIEQCRTEALGGHLYECSACHEQVYSYHSCKNRSCPKCGNDAAQAWLAKQQALLLPVQHFLVTFTLPEGLRQVARSNQEIVYNLLFRSRVPPGREALQELAADPRFVGGKIGAVGVLQTWTRDLRFHPHVHFVVPGGGLSADGQRWLPSRHNFLVRVEPLGILFRNKFRDGLKQTGLFAKVPSQVWQQSWVVDCRPVGAGASALKYLAPYIFRIAIANNRILKLENDHVTFRYKDGDSSQWRTATVTAEEFIRRFLQHVLPKGFVKVRAYGLLAAGNRALLRQAQALLGLTATTPPAEPADKLPQTASPAPSPTLACPKCGQPMLVIQRLPRRSRSPP